MFKFVHYIHTVNVQSVASSLVAFFLFRPHFLLFRNVRKSVQELHLKLNRTNKSPRSDSTFTMLLFTIHQTFCLEKLALGLLYEKDRQTNVKFSKIRNGTRHFWNFRSIWSISGLSSVAHCPTRKTRGSFHTFRPVVQIFYTRAVHSVRLARNISHPCTQTSSTFLCQYLQFLPITSSEKV